MSKLSRASVQPTFHTVVEKKEFQLIYTCVQLFPNTQISCQSHKPVTFQKLAVT